MYDFGFQDNLNDIKIQPDQKIIITGVELTPAFAGVLKVLRLKTDGTPDNSFANNGIYSLLIGNESYGYRSAITQDGKIIVAGITYDANYQADWLLLRLDSTGVIDSSFGNNGITMVDFYNQDDLAYALALQPDGKIVVGGTFTDPVNYFNNPCIMRFTADGQVDSTFGNNGSAIYPGIDIDNRLYNMIVQPNGKISACGHYSKVFTGSQDFDIFIFQTDSSGVPDAGFGVNGAVITSINGGIDESFGLDMDADGNLVVAGFTTLPVTLEYDMVILKLDSAGVPVNTFGNSGMVTFHNSEFDVAMDVKVQPDNKIVVGGSSGLSFFGPRDFAILRYLPSGLPDPAFGNNGFVATAIMPNFQDCNAIALQADGKIVAAGRANNGLNNDMAVVRYLNDLGTFINETHGVADFSVYPNPVASGDYLVLNFEKLNGKELSVSILDVTGRIMLNKTYQDSNISRLMLQIPQDFSTGMYLLRLSDGSQQVSKKILVR